MSSIYKFFGIVIISILFYLILVHWFPMDFVIYSLEDNFSDKTGYIGDTIGGILSPLIAIMAAFLTFLAFYKQVEANKQVQKQFQRQQFETNYFEMLKIYRENVNEWMFLSVTDENKNKNERYLNEGRIVGNQIYGLFKELFEEIGDFLNLSQTNIDLYLEPNYKKELNKLRFSDNSKKIIDLEEFLKLELSTIILYYGVGNISIENLKTEISGKYTDKTIDLFNFLNLKPIRSSKYWNDWIKKKEKKDTTPHKSKNGTINTTKYYKYYGGHEHRLGHYFRHLYSIIRYVNKQTQLTYTQKWEYIAMLRAQMSNKEQFLLYLYSISFIGRHWELNPSKIDDIDKYDHIQKSYITKYDLVKYIPKGTRNIYFKNNFYPDVQFSEQSNLTPNRKKLEKKYK